MLIDEAQDTSPQQWDIIKRFVAEFTAGAGARGSLWRSIFAVGDDKQSIFSFQDAAPEAFAEMRRFFETAHGKRRAAVSADSRSTIPSGRCRSCWMRWTRCSGSRPPTPG